MSCAFPCHTHQNRMHGRYAMGIRDEAGAGTETDEENERQRKLRSATPSRQQLPKGPQKVDESHLGEKFWVETSIDISNLANRIHSSSPDNLQLG